MQIMAQPEQHRESAAGPSSSAARMRAEEHPEGSEGAQHSQQRPLVMWLYHNCVLNSINLFRKSTLCYVTLD